LKECESVGEPSVSKKVRIPYGVLGIGSSWSWEFLAQAWSSRNVTVRQNPYLNLYCRFRIRALQFL